MHFVGAVLMLVISQLTLATSSHYHQLSIVGGLVDRNTHEKYHQGTAPVVFFFIIPEATMKFSCLQNPDSYLHI
jgi:hypothetical protein